MESPAAAGGQADKLKPQRQPERSGHGSVGEEDVHVHVECKHGFALISGEHDASLRPACVEAGCKEEGESWLRSKGFLEPAVAISSSGGQGQEPLGEATPMPVVELADEGEVAVALEGDVRVALLPAQQVLGLCDGCSAISMAMDKLGVPHVVRAVESKTWACGVAARLGVQHLEPGDVRQWTEDKAQGRRWVQQLGHIDIVSCGFPCQDVATARRGGPGLEGKKVGRWGGPARDLLPNTSVPFS